MTQTLDPRPTDRVLEIGTGSGYQAAVLAEIVREVYSVEIVSTLAKSAQKRLKELDYDNVSVRDGDGYLGWEEHAPFDKIIVTCSPESVPEPLIEQLREGGIMIIPTFWPSPSTMALVARVVDKDTISTRPSFS